MIAEQDYWDFDETGGMFTCDKCRQTKFVDANDFDDQQVLEWLERGDEIWCGTCDKDSGE